MITDDYTWICACCGKEMRGLPIDISFINPGNWQEIPWYQKLIAYKNSDFFTYLNDEWRRERFIRCVLPIPVTGTEEEFRFGVWCSVSRASWRIYRKGFDTGIYAKDFCFGYLCNEIPDFRSSFNLHADVDFGDDNQRPRVYLHDSDHPLVSAQREGVSWKQIESWVQATTRH